MLLQNYDMNYNEKFDKEELKLIEVAMLDFKLKLEPLRVFSLHTEDKEVFFDLVFLPFSLIKFADESLILQANENTNMIFFELTLAILAAFNAKSGVF